MMRSAAGLVDDALIVSDLGCECTRVLQKPHAAKIACSARRRGTEWLMTFFILEEIVLTKRRFQRFGRGRGTRSSQAELF